MGQVLDVVEMETCVRGFHVYKVIWEATFGEELECGRERDNREDRYAVAVVKDEAVVGRVLRKVSVYRPSGFGSSFLVAGLKYCSNAMCRLYGCLLDLQQS